MEDNKSNPIFMMHLFEILLKYNTRTQRHTHTYMKTRTRDSLWSWAGGSPTKTPAVALAAFSDPPWVHREYQLFCCDRVGLPTTATSQEREGKPGYGPHPKIDPIFYIYIYRSLVYTQSRCLPKGYLQIRRATGLPLSERELATMKNIFSHYP